METVQYAQSNRIVELMRQPEEQRDAEWLKDAVQQAVLLELATLPPYLCGMWSLDTTSGDRFFRTLNTIVFDEMSHLGIACNMLTTIGGTPRLAGETLVPGYPGPLPGGVRPELTVFLSGLTKDSVTMYASIEKPDAPVTPAPPAAYTSIGAFYTAIRDAFRASPHLISAVPHRQVTRNMETHGSGNSLVPLTTLDSVESAIKVIKEQGEGTSASPENPFPDPGTQHELAHYYAFLQILRDLSDPGIPGPPILPMGVVPRGGWPRTGPGAPVPEVTALLDKSNRAFSDMLRLLEQVWQQDDSDVADDLLNNAVTKMFKLRSPARDLMKRALPDGSGKNYGPEFRYVAA